MAATRRYAASAETFRTSINLPERFASKAEAIKWADDTLQHPLVSRVGVRREVLVQEHFDMATFTVAPAWYDDGPVYEKKRIVTAQERQQYMEAA